MAEMAEGEDRGSSHKRSVTAHHLRAALGRHPIPIPRTLNALAGCESDPGKRMGENKARSHGAMMLLNAAQAEAVELIEGSMIMGLSADSGLGVKTISKGKGLYTAVNEAGLSVKPAAGDTRAELTAL